jgi:hypothetical protein
MPTLVPDLQKPAPETITEGYEVDRPIHRKDAMHCLRLTALRKRQASIEWQILSRLLAMFPTKLPKQIEVKPKAVWGRDASLVSPFFFCFHHRCAQNASQSRTVVTVECSAILLASLACRSISFPDSDQPPMPVNPLRRARTQAGTRKEYPH